MKDSLERAQVSIRDYLFILFYRKKVFLFPALIVFFTATIGSFFLPKYYSSAVLVLVQEEENIINPLAVKSSYIPAQTPTLIEQLKTLTEKVLNYPQLLMVIRELGLEKKISSPLELEKLILSIRKRVEIQLRSPEVFEISYEDKDPKMAQQLVNTLVESFIRYNVEKKRELALAGVKFAETQAENYKKKLEESEKVLYEFRKEFPLQSPGKDTDINISLLINYQTNLTNTEISLQEIQGKLKVIEAQLSGEESLPVSNDLIELNPIIGSLSEEIRKEQMNLDDLLKNNPASPNVLNLEIRLDDLKRRLSEETERVIDNQTFQTSPLLMKKLEDETRNYRNEIKVYKERIDAFKRLVAEYEGRIASLPEQDRIYSQLLRDSKVNSNIYEMLVLKVEENRLDAVELQQRGINYEVLETGRLPLKPSKPQKLIISLVALFLGIFTGLGSVFLVEMADHSFRNVEDACKCLSIPVIGSTMKILTLYESAALKKKRGKFMLIMILVLFVFIIAAVVTSVLQEKMLTERIIREQMREAN
ncbi:MAG: hypothetical protein HY810_00505 [Candidatus Omnitrophica bacterium]|nr:hypothetical protein [Candidatus Omnitrophota bacterium]